MPLSESLGHFPGLARTGEVSNYFENLKRHVSTPHIENEKTKLVVILVKVCRVSKGFDTAQGKLTF